MDVRPSCGRLYTLGSLNALEAALFERTCSLHEVLLPKYLSFICTLSSPISVQQLALEVSLCSAYSVRRGWLPAPRKSSRWLEIVNFEKLSSHDNLLATVWKVRLKSCSTFYILHSEAVFQKKSTNQMSRLKTKKTMMTRGLCTLNP